MKSIEKYFGKTVKVFFESKENFSLIKVIGFDPSNDVILETLEQHRQNQKPKLNGFVNPFTVDQLWFNTELTGRKINLIQM